MSDPKHLWQNQKREQTAMSVEDLQRKLQKIDGRMRRQSVVNSAIAAAVLVLFGRILVTAPRFMDRLGWALVVIGTAIMLTQSVRGMLRSFRGERLPSSGGITTCLDFYRRMIEQRRRLTAGYPAATVLLIAGLIVLLISPIGAFYAALEQPGPPDLTPWIPFLGLIGLWGISFILLRRRARSWLRREVEILNALEKDRPQIQRP